MTLALMSILYWNIRGTSIDVATQVLADLIRTHRPKIAFLIKTKT